MGAYISSFWTKTESPEPDIELGLNDQNNDQNMVRVVPEQKTSRAVAPKIVPIEGLIEF